MKPIHRALVLTVAGVLTLSISGCEGDSPTATSEGDDSTATLTVLAASSLTGSFTELADEFESDNPGTTVSISFGSSSTLATQVIDGAPADVLATASSGSMEPVVDEQLTAGEPTTFATNQAAVATPPDNPAGLHELADLDNQGVKIAVCVETAPCGSVAAELFDEANVNVTPVTEEIDVKSVLAKVTTGEVDAGVVYRTDVLAAGSEVAEVDLPSGIVVTTDYLIAPLAEATDADLAAAFVALVNSEHGQTVLADAGFDVH